MMAVTNSINWEGVFNNRFKQNEPDLESPLLTRICNLMNRYTKEKNKLQSKYDNQKETVDLQKGFGKTFREMDPTIEMDEKKLKELSIRLSSMQEKIKKLGEFLVQFIQSSGAALNVVDLDTGNTVLHHLIYWKLPASASKGVLHALDQSEFDLRDTVNKDGIPPGVLAYMINNTAVIEHFEKRYKDNQENALFRVCDIHYLQTLLPS